MWRIKVGLSLLFFFSYIAYSEQGGVCDIKEMTSLKNPPIIKNQTSHVNSSLDIRTCGPSGSLDIIYKMIPEKITSKVRFIDIEFSFMAPSTGLQEFKVADDDGGFLDAYVVYEPDNIRMKYSAGYDCGIIEEDLECPLPIKKGEWLYFHAICDTRFYLPDMIMKLNLKLQNYDGEEVCCIEGQLRTF